ncbi:surface protease GP63, partial [Trypanosoma theileri]
VQSTGVVRELPRKGKSGVQAYTVATQNENEEWKLIRIKASTKDLDNKSRYCTQIGDKVMNFQDDIDDCVASQILTEEKKSMFIDHIIPGAIRMHRDRLLVQPQEGKLEVPNFENGNPCTHFTVPSDHHSEGVENADFVLYVAAGTGEPFGVTCAREESSGRPIAGAMNFPPYYLVDPRLNVRIAAHEMAHA